MISFVQVLYYINYIVYTIYFFNELIEALLNFNHKINIIKILFIFRIIFYI